MYKPLIALLVVMASVGLTWAPPYSPVEIVSSAPAGGCSQTNVIKEYVDRANGLIQRYACVGGSWTAMKVKVGNISTGNSATDEYCLTYEASGTTLEWQVCGSGGGSGGGTSTINEGGTSATTTATIINFSSGFDVAVTTTDSTDDTATITLDYTEAQVPLGTGVSGSLPVANGGTGATDATTARSNLGAAKSGANNDITSITGLSTPLAPAMGGVGIATNGTDDDNVLVSTGTGTWQTKEIPDCQAGNQLLYTASTNTFSCEADGASGTGSYKIAQEEGASLGADGSGTTLNFVGAALTAAGTGAVKTITLAQSGTGAAVIDSGYTVTAGTGLGGGGLLSGTEITLTTASTEAGFLADGGASNLTCSTSNQGKMQVMDNGVVQWCDGATTSVLRYSALGDASGNAATGDSATSFFSAGTLEVARGGTGAASLGTSGQVLFNDGGVMGYDETGSSFSYDKSTDVLTVGTINTSGAADNSRYLELQRNSADVGVPTSGYIRVYGSGTAGSEVLKYYTATGGIKTTATLTGSETLTNKTLTTPVVTGKVDRNNVTVDDDDCTSEQGLYWYDTTDSAFEFCNANSGTPTTIGAGSGDITDVWGCSTGDCETLTAGAADSLDATSAASLRLPYGTAPTVSSTGAIGVDSSADQLVYYSGAAAYTIPAKLSTCAVLEDLTSSDDSYEFWEAPYGVTITDVSCRCRGTCSTAATFTLEDRGGNAMTITGTNPTCSTTGNSTYAAVTAGNALVEGEGIAFDVTNSPDPATDEYTICVRYTVTRQ